MDYMLYGLYVFSQKFLQQLKTILFGRTWAGSTSE